MPSKGMSRKVLTLNNINPFVKEMQNNVQIAFMRRASEIERELEKGISKPFTEVIRADISDTQAMGQKPLTFIRQVLTVCSYPSLLKDPSIPLDVKKRANEILDDCGGRSTGAYTYSEGIDLVRCHISQFIKKRDGFPARPEDIILCSGSTEALRSILNVLHRPTNGKPTGVLVPVPCDPSTTITLNEFGITQIDYFLEEENDWSISINELTTTIDAASHYCSPRAILIVNPGNPTGCVLSRKNMENIIKFAAFKKLVLLADESYQFNIYGEETQFHAFKKILMEMGPPFSKVELVAFMSASNGILGECGLRAGCCELVNIQPDVVKVYQKSICVKMCPSVLGQVALDCLICPPEPGQTSYRQFFEEKNEVLHSLKERAMLVTKSLNAIDGVRCSRVVGAVHAFPRIFLPPKAIVKAQSQGLSPDLFYAIQLMEATGVCALPGNCFGQLPGTYHLSITILPPKEKLKKMLENIKCFHCKFLEEYK